MINCLHPVTVSTPHGPIKVPCGKCSVCLNRKSSQLTNQCLIESKSHKYTFFVTLTYADDFLPVCRVVKRSGYYHFVDYSLRNTIGSLGIDDTPVMATVPCTRFDDDFFIDYYRKLSLPKEMYGCIPYLSRRDLQLFLKRLRKNISKIFSDNAQIRYFACGEYGPVHFRPHFHLLFFFDSYSLSLKMRDLILASWSFGRIDCQLSKGGCGNYCSKYINGVSHLSAIQRLKNFKPFATHSRHFAISFFQNETKKIDEVTFTNFIGKTLSSTNKIIDIYPWMAFENTLFPRCYGYGQSDSLCRHFVYTLFSRLSLETNCTNVNSIVSLCIDSVNNGSPYYSLSEFLSIFSGYIKFHKLDKTLLSVLYLSRKFLKLCSRFNLSTFAYLRIIERYHSSKDYYLLCKQLREQSDYMLRSDADPVFLLSWYSNFIPNNSYYQCQYDYRLSELDDLYQHSFNLDKRYLSLQRDLLLNDSPFDYPLSVKSYCDSIGIDYHFLNDFSYDVVHNPIYINIATMSNRIMHSSIKHKKLQDLNKIFTYGKHNGFKGRS